MNFGLEVKRLRKLKGISQLELSQRLYMDVSTLSKYETGKLKMKSDMFVNALEVLSINIGEYIKDLRNEKNITRELLSKISYCEESEIEMLEDNFDYLYKDIVSNVIRSLALYAKSCDVLEGKFCFMIGEIVTLSDADDWLDISVLDKKADSKFKVVFREVEEDGNQYYRAVSMQTNEIFEGYAPNFDSLKIS